MASVTAEVLLYFGTDNKKFREAVDALRFDGEDERSVQEIIDLLSPIYRAGYDEGWDDAGLN